MVSLVCQGRCKLPGNKDNYGQAILALFSLNPYLFILSMFVPDHDVSKEY